MRRETPLIEFLGVELKTATPKDAGVRMWERPFLGHVNLRGEPSDGAFLTAVQIGAGTGLPLEPNTTVESKDIEALWLGPNEWLLITGPDRQGELIQRLRDNLKGVYASVVDVSGGQTVIRVTGTQAREVLSKGCPLDLHPRAFGPGRCAQSHIAKANALVRQIDAVPTYDIIVRRSFAEYLARWLKDAAQEYGLAIVREQGV